jgi:hypothetical protein
VNLFYLISFLLYLIHFANARNSFFISSHPRAIEVKEIGISIGDFYDIDGYFAKHIKPTDRVLLYGFHNLYYVDFPFIDNSWVAKGNTFNYVAVQGNGMPDRFKYWTLVYFNPITQVRLYTFKGQTWFY